MNKQTFTFDGINDDEGLSLRSPQGTASTNMNRTLIKSQGGVAKRKSALVVSRGSTIPSADIFVSESASNNVIEAAECNDYQPKPGGIQGVSSGAPTRPTT